MSAGAFFARWRVRLGYPLAILVLVFARPTPQSILYGALVGGIGLFVRAMAAGHLHKQLVLTVTGPYAHTRNPLYLGSALLALAVVVVIVVLGFLLVWKMWQNEKLQECYATGRRDCAPGWHACCASASPALKR